MKLFSIFFSVIFFSISACAQIELNFGLRADYPFTGNANDASGNNNNPAFNNVTLTRDRAGNPNQPYHSTNSYDLFLGRLNNATFPYSLNGDLDEVRIYERDINQDEVNVLGGYTSISCNNWLRNPSQPSYIDIGQLNIGGNKLTVEATINRTMPYVPGIGDNNEGDVVSKHDNPSDVNYLLRPNHAYITTTNGYFATPDICQIELNKTYHIAMVYDGATLKFYRNGYLMSSVNATGNLFQNSWPTRIGRYSGTYLSTFLGYINEVRIWNVDRTQAEIQAYMNTSLPNPTTQTGLQAYYIFDDLTNKQGNAAWNGILGGSASINATNSTCNFNSDSCVVTPCNSWLYTSTNPSYINIGDLDVSGTNITVEANINRTQPYVPGGGDNSEGDVVSKHTDPVNVNYLLRPNHAYITTTNGFFGTPDICPVDLNKTYHVAMVYNGSALKFYRNGYLMSQVSATGNLILNNLNTQIGLYPGGIYNTQFVGFINEVRIWNVARTQPQIQASMNISLPTPTSQPGLLAYYTFDNLLNKQGNNAFDGIQNGGASINNSSLNCVTIIDSCNIVIPVRVTDFQASVINNKIIKLFWSTEEESGIKNYAVERTVSGSTDFIVVGNIAPKITSTTNSYSIFDNTARPNVLYNYRLAITDFDGSNKYSQIKTARINNQLFYSSVYPNPSTGFVKLNVSNSNEKTSVLLVNSLGQTTLQRSINAASIPETTLDLSSEPKGNYWIIVQTNTDKNIHRLILQ